jgi:hypothetical protein
MSVTKFGAPKPICVHDEKNAESAQVKPPATLQANRSRTYINKCSYQLISPVQIHMRLTHHILAMTFNYLQEVLNMELHMVLKWHFVESKY